jgi:hypothetical protein
LEHDVLEVLFREEVIEYHGGHSDNQDQNNDGPAPLERREQALAPGGAPP